MQFGDPEVPERVVTDLGGSHVWEASPVSAERHGRLTGRLATR